jgi:hypothetical protein
MRSIPRATRNQYRRNTAISPVGLDANVDLEGASLTEHPDQCALGISADDRIINNNDLLALNDFSEWVEL